MQKSISFLQKINSKIENINEKINLSQLQGKTIVFIIDMVNGFAHKNGSMFDAKIKEVIAPINKLVKSAIKNNINIIAFNDNHSEHSPEFNYYPVHCLEDSFESQLVSELNYKEIKIIKKNSYNAFYAFDFKPNLLWDNVVIVGCCTDICIYQFALSCKAWFNQHSKDINVFVPKKMVNTFDNENHPYELINNLALNSMIDNGIRVIEDIE